MVRVGITDHAQQQLGDVVLVELPTVGDTVAVGDAVRHGRVHEVGVGDLPAGRRARSSRVNEALADEPELVNQAPYGGGWMFELRPADAAQLDGLLDAAAYDRLTDETDRPPDSTCGRASAAGASLDRPVPGLGAAR